MMMDLRPCMQYSLIPEYHYLPCSTSFYMFQCVFHLANAISLLIAKKLNIRENIR